jgi:putative addiction module antidote
MFELKLTKIGDSLGVILPKEILAKLRLNFGDKIFVAETPGGIELTPYDLDFVKQMDIVESIVKENRNVLKKLAD